MAWTCGAQHTPADTADPGEVGAVFSMVRMGMVSLSLKMTTDEIMLLPA